MRAVAVLLLVLTVSMPGWSATATTAATQAMPAASAATAASAARPELVDINRASLDDLKGLKGIGDVRAAAIVKGRPYTRKDDLVRRGILPQSVYDEIRDRVIARQ